MNCKLKAYKNGYIIYLGNENIFALKILIATGRIYKWPDIPGSKAKEGISIFHCPYCDGYEWVDKPVAIIADKAKCERVVEYIKTLRQWTKTIVYAKQECYNKFILKVFTYIAKLFF